MYGVEWCTSLTVSGCCGKPLNLREGVSDMRGEVKIYLFFLNVLWFY